MLRNHERIGFTRQIETVSVAHGTAGEAQREAFLPKERQRRCRSSPLFLFFSAILLFVVAISTPSVEVFSSLLKELEFYFKSKTHLS